MAEDPGKQSSSSAAASSSSSPAATQQKPQDSEQLTVEGWKNRARLFEGGSRHAIAGALHDAEADATFTRQQVENALKSFGEREL